jgi:hypothetical protein
MRISPRHWLWVTASALLFALSLFVFLIEDRRHDHRLRRVRGGVGRAGPTCAGANRIAFPTRTCGNFPAATKLYTLAFDTRSLRATSATVSKQSVPPSASSKLAANVPRTPANPGEALDPTESPLRVLPRACETPPPPARSVTALGVQMVAGSNPVAPT